VLASLAVLLCACPASPTPEDFRFACSKDNPCVAGFECIDRVCVRSQKCVLDTDCDDYDPCSQDACGGGGKCTHSSVQDASPCGLEGGTCKSGNCTWPVQGAWPSFGRDPHGSRRSPHSGPKDGAKIAWKFEALKNAKITGGAVTGPEKLVIFAVDRYLRGLDTTKDASNPDTSGFVKWTYDATRAIKGTPAIDRGKVYFGSEDGTVHAVSEKDGMKLWTKALGGSIASSPVVDLKEGNIYVAAADGTIYNIPADGGDYSVNKASTKPFLGCPALNLFGKSAALLIGGTDATFYALQQAAEAWSYTTGDEIHGCPAVGSDGTIYVGSTDSFLYALKADGKLRWRLQFDDWLEAAPAIAEDGTIYVGCDAKSQALTAITPNGDVKWKFETQQASFSSPLIGGDGLVYFAATEGVYCLNPDGTKRWSLPVEGGLESSPTLDDTGTLYVGTLTGSLLAISE